MKCKFFVQTGKIKMSYTFKLVACMTLLQFMVLKVGAQCDGNTLKISVGYEGTDIKFPESGEYDKNQTCTWLFTSKTENRILYKAYDIDIHCPDSLSVYDGSTEAAQVKTDKACRNPQNSVFSRSLDSSSGKTLFVKFISGGDMVRGKGFRIFLISAPSNTDCADGMTTTLTATMEPQVLTSPMFPDKYPKNKKCSWMFKPKKEGFLVKLDFRFVDIDFDSSKKTCPDKIQIKTGNVSSEVCGSDNIKPMMSFTSEAGSNMTLSFMSDDIQEENGFVVVYVEVDGMKEPTFMQKYLTIIIVVVVIVAVIIIVVVAVTIIFCCKRKKKSSKKDEVYNPEEAVKLSETPTD